MSPVEVFSPGPSSPLMFTPTPSTSGDTVSVNSGASSSIIISDGEIVTPSHWRPEVEDCLQIKQLTETRSFVH